MASLLSSVVLGSQLSSHLAVDAAAGALLVDPSDLVVRARDADYVGSLVDGELLPAAAVQRCTEPLLGVPLR